MIWWLSVGLLWLQACSPGQAVSVDLYHMLSAQWILPPDPAEPADAYFGYSITYHPAYDRLIVSAPQHDRVGEVYACNPGSSNTSEENCIKVPKDIELTEGLDYYNHTYWFGATVKAGPSFFVTCAPMYIERHRFKETAKKPTNNIGTFARCYKYYNPTDNATYLVSMQDTQKQYSDKTFLYEHIMDSFGWSIDISNNGILIGGPAMFSGRVIKYGTNESTFSDDLTGYNKKTEQRVARYNFGYSIATGYFLKQPITLLHAIGSPYGDHGDGKVLFYQTNNAQSNTMSLIKNFNFQLDNEDVVGSMWGAVLCAARHTKDSTSSSLVVGAPTFGRKGSQGQRFNLGAVLFYEPLKTPSEPRPKLYRKIVGNKDNSYFGSAILNVGDFNGDGMDEIAISAPYESGDWGTGSVYVYSSKDIRSDSEDITYIQRILPEKTTSPVNSFGLSLTTIQSYGENSCNALAIGAPETNKVNVLSCIVFVTVLSKDLKWVKKEAQGNDTHMQYEVESCLRVEFPDKLDLTRNPFTVNVSIGLRHEDAELFPKITNYNIALDRTIPEPCSKIIVLTSKNGNYEQPITYTINITKLLPPTSDGSFEQSLVALSDRTDFYRENEELISDCVTPICKPDLKLTVTVPETFVIGSSDAIGLKATVHNEGLDVAYRACVKMFVDGADVVSVPTGCEHKAGLTTELSCHPDSLLRKQDAPWELPEISLDTTNLTSDSKLIDVRFEVYSHCKDSVADMGQKKQIALRTEPETVVVKGITDAGDDYVNVTADDVDGKSFEHSYTIMDSGKTNWVNVIATVVRQKRSFIEYHPIIVRYVSLRNNIETTINCTLKEQDDKTATEICPIDLFNEPIKFTVPMMITATDNLETVIKDKQNTQFTSLTIEFNGATKQDTVKSIINYIGKVPIWIYIVAAIVGLLILLIICFVLYKYGFFSRKKKTALANVRKSVRRQTMMRRTMVEGVQLPLASDRESLVRNVPEESAEEATARDKRVRLDSNATRKK